MPKLWKDLSRLRTFEMAIFVIFIILGLISSILVMIPRSTAMATYPDPNIEVSAYNMPNQGWASLTVYFSPFGSFASESEIMQ